MPKENKQMIQIQLLREGRVVKQITSRVHESVVLEQVKLFEEAFDTVQITKGELSEGAHDVLKHVAKRIIPAAMAAGVALGGHGAAQAQNRDFPGLDRSIGQHISDVVSPRYNEIQRQRKYEQDTQRQEWDAQQNELRKARIAAARASGQQAAGIENLNHKVYDQSRVSQDGKYFIIYGMDDKVTRIPVTGTEYMAGDSQRMGHYISPNGQVYYVRHPHLKNGLGEGYNDEAHPIHDDGNEGKPGKQWYGHSSATAQVDTVTFEVDSENAYNHVMKQFGSVISWDGESMVAPRKYWGAIQELALSAGGNAEEYGTVDEGVAIWDKDGYDNLVMHYYNGGNKVSEIAQELGIDEDEVEYIIYKNEQSVGEGVATIGTVGTIPASGTNPTKRATNAPTTTPATPAGVPQQTTTGDKENKFTPTGKTTNVTFNQQGQLELGDEDQLDPKAAEILKKAGVKVAESKMSELDQIVQDNAAAVAQFKQTGYIDDANLEADLHSFFYDMLSPQAQRDADDEGELDALFAEALGMNLGEATLTEDDSLDAILDQYADAYNKFKQGADLEDGFYNALVDYFTHNGEMPNGTQDAHEWITQRLDQEGGVEPMGESDDNEASPADQASADKNIIMQLRRVSDYEVPVPMELGDGSIITIAASTAQKILTKFAQLKPDSKLLMQQTLNTSEGFREMLNYFNEREIQDEGFVDEISNHMKPVLEAHKRANRLIKSVFGK
jgi:hypothetical protein